jgi:hypothetical protein
MRTGRILIVGFIVIALSAGWACGSSSSAGGQATAPSAAPVRVTVTGVAPTVGTAAPFAATATLVDGRTRVVTAEAAWQTSNAAIVSVDAAGVVTAIDPGDADVRATYQNVTGSTHVTIAKPHCDASLWSHVYDPQRLQIRNDCQTVTGVIMQQHDNSDGDIDIRVAVDPAYAHLLNDANMTKLNGWLQTEAICQAPIQPQSAGPQRACTGFAGSVTVPPVGTRVLVTGTYVLDANHGWMELHPISVLSPR